MATDPVLLELDLTHGLLEAPAPDPFTAWRSRHVPVLPSLIEKLREAAKAPEVGALVAHVGGGELSAAQAEELGGAVEAFSATGKRTFAWAESFGEGGGGTTPFHLAAHFDEIWLQPSGGLDATGVAAGGLFARSLLDKLGIQPQIHARHEYKNAPDTALRDSMSEPQREALQALVDGALDALTATLVRRRDLTPGAVAEAIAAAPLNGAQALERGLIDALGYRDEVYAAAKAAARGIKPTDAASDGASAKATDDADEPKIKLSYAHHWQRPLAARLRAQAPKVARQVRAKLSDDAAAEVIALVGVTGGIVSGSSGGSPLGGQRAGSSTITAALRQAGQQDDVAAVVLRIDSPGGSYVASDAIHREVLRLKEAGTPVVASMGSVAASGGYFAAMAADEIVALPTTITGSIGVFAGKLVVAEAMRKAGVTQEFVTTGHQAGMWSGARPFTEHELAHLDRWLDEVYEDFTQKAATGRGMTHAELEPLARGRVWTGSAAAQRGLVDTLGGLETAIEAAATRAGILRADATVRRYPHLTPIDHVKTPKNSEAPGASVGAGAFGGLGGGLAGATIAALFGGSGSGATAGGNTAMVPGGSLATAPEQLLTQLAAALGLTPAGALRLPL